MASGSQRWLTMQRDSGRQALIKRSLIDIYGNNMIQLTKRAYRVKLVDDN
jgi:hypothetical protein